MGSFCFGSLAWEGLVECVGSPSGIKAVYAGLYSPEFQGVLIYGDKEVQGSTQLLDWVEIPILDANYTNAFVSNGKFTDTLNFNAIGMFSEDRTSKQWLNNQRLVFVYELKNGQAFISGEENGYTVASFQDATNASGQATNASWQFVANTSYEAYGITQNYLDKVKESAVCGDYTTLFALGNTTSIQKQASCEVQAYDGWV